MIIARVVGTAIATLKHNELGGTKLLLLRRADTSGGSSGDVFVAVDLVGAGEGELVIVTEGSSARIATGVTSSPTDAAIVGIIDALRAGGKTEFRKE